MRTKKVEFTPQIMRAIEQRKAHAASDAAINDSKIGGHQMLIDLENRTKMQNTLCHKRQDNNTNEGAETITLLELIAVIRKKGKCINNGKITVGIGNKKVHRGVVRTINKASEHAQDTGVEIAQMRKILRNIKFKIEFKFTQMCKNRQCNLQCQPLEALLKACDEKTKKSLEKDNFNERETNIRFVGFTA